MSKDHTRLADGEVDRRVEAVKQTQNTVIELERINERSRKHIEEIQHSINSLSEVFEGTRKSFMARLESMEKESLQSLYRFNGNIDEARQELDAIRLQLGECSGMISQILEDKRKNLSSAVDWYNEVKTGYLLIKDNPDYKKFAQDKLDSLKDNIDYAESIADWSSESVQTFVQLRLSDIYQIDLCVSENRRRYEELEVETCRMAYGILENAKALRQRLMLGIYNVGKDLDHWTGMKFNDVEDEVSAILEELKNRRNDPEFQIKKVNELLERLKELDKVKDMLAKMAIENVRLSGFCKSEVMLAGRLLEEKHKFKLVASGYEGGDNRKCFIARYSREDGAEVEFIGAYGEEKGTIQLIRRINTSAYMSKEVLNTLEDGIRSILSGTTQINVESSTSCGPEQLDPFATSISAQTRQNHGIPSIQLGVNY